jgi:tRNA-Thr(GGU) m(6)t(6)A37 methyltransferase TsaA
MNKKVQRKEVKKGNSFSATPEQYHNYLLKKNYIQDSSVRRDFMLNPIGIIHSPHKESAGTPIQPRMAEGVKGTITIYKKFAQGLKDLKGFERIWLIYWFDRAGPTKMMVAPYMDSRLRGIFATRAPCRPNPLGISCVRLLAIKGSTLYVSDLDCLDGTPLLDIKPYVPKFDSYRVKKWGWLEKQGKTRAKADEQFEAKKQSLTRG